MPDWLLSPIAEREVDEIITYIAEQSGSIETALTVLEDLESGFGILAKTPMMGREREELTGTGPRWWRVHRYLIIYDPNEAPLRILRVIHGARDLKDLLG